MIFVMDEAIKEAIELIEAQEAKLEQIKPTIVRYCGDGPVTRYERWKEHTRKLLAARISEEEAKRFQIIQEQREKTVPETGKFGYEYRKIKPFFLTLKEGLMDGSIELSGTDWIGQRFRVLSKLYDLTVPRNEQKIFYDDFYREVGLERKIIDRALEYWEQKYLIQTDENDIWLTSDGIDEVLRTRQHPERPTPFNPAYVVNYTDNRITIQGDNIGQAQAGNNATQSLINNQPISEILPKLAELIAAVGQADFEDRDEVVRDLEKVQQLAQSDDPKSKWALIQSKLTSAKTAMEIVGFTYKTLPYWPVIWHYFFR